MRVQVNEIGIDYKDEGAGLPVVFIHAYPLNKTMWDEQVDALKNRCRIVAPDPVWHLRRRTDWTRGRKAGTVRAAKRPGAGQRPFVLLRLTINSEPRS